MSFFAKSTKQLGSPGRQPNHTEFKYNEGQEEPILSDKKIYKKSKINKSNISHEIEEEKKEDEMEEKKEEDTKEQRLNKQKALEEAIRKDIEKRKMQKNGQNAIK